MDWGSIGPYMHWKEKSVTVHPKRRRFDVVTVAVAGLDRWSSSSWSLPTMAGPTFHRAVGVRSRTDAFFRLIWWLSVKLLADYDVLRLAFDSPWVYRSIYSFDLRNWPRIWFSEGCTRCVRRNASKNMLPRCCRGGRAVAEDSREFLVATNSCPSIAENGRAVSGYDRGWPRSCSGVAGILGSDILSNTWRAGFIFILFFI